MESKLTAAVFGEARRMPDHVIGKIDRYAADFGEARAQVMVIESYAEQIVAVRAAVCAGLDLMEACGRGLVMPADGVTAQGQPVRLTSETALDSARKARQRLAVFLSPRVPAPATPSGS